MKSETVRLADNCHKILDAARLSQAQGYDFDKLIENVFTDMCKLCSEYVSNIINNMNNSDIQIFESELVKSDVEDISYLYYMIDSLVEPGGYPDEGWVHPSKPLFSFPATSEFSELNYYLADAYDYLNYYGLIDL